jgi:hypothetical protein
MAVCESVTIPGMTGHVRRNTHEGEISISLNFFSAQFAEFGRIVWIADQAPEGITIDDVDSFLEYPGESLSSNEIDLTNAAPIVTPDWPLFFVPDNGGGIVNSGTYWELTSYGWGESLLRTLLRESYQQHTENLDSLRALPLDRGYDSGSKLTAMGMDLTLKYPERELYLSFQPDSQAPWVIKVLWDLLPEETMIGIARDELDNLLTEGEPETTPGESTEATELRRTQRTITALAIGLAKKYPSYRHGEKPNVSQLAVLAAEPFLDENAKSPTGWTSATFKKAIEAALASTNLPEE